MTNLKSISNKTNSKYYKLFDICLLRICLLICLFAYLLICLLPKVVYAQSLSLSLWPPLLEVMIQPGKTVTQVYKLTNNSDHEIIATPQIFPFEPKGNSGEIKIMTPSNKATEQQSYFFSFENAQFNQPFPLAIGQTKELILKISLPSDSPQKDSYFTLLFSTAELPQEGQAQSSSITQIGSNILLAVSRSGLPSLSGKIIEFSTSKIIDSFSPVDFKLILENDGSSFWKPFGEIKISGSMNQNDKVPLLQQNVLSNSFRKMEISPYRPRLAIGQFKSVLEFTLNEGGTTISQTISFWYIPYKLFIILISLIIIFIFMKKWLKKIVHRG